LYWIPSILWMALIFYLSGRTGNELHTLFPFLNNLNPGHIIAYFVLGPLFYLPLHKYHYNHPFLKALLLCFFYGLTDEIHQYFIPTRCPDVSDLLRDIFGAGLGLAAVYLVRRKS